MIKEIRSVKVTIFLLLAAFASYGFGALLPGATGYIPAALVAAMASYTAQGTQSRPLRITALTIAVIMLFLAIAMNLFSLGLTIGAEAI